MQIPKPGKVVWLVNGDDQGATASCRPAGTAAGTSTKRSETERSVSAALSLSALRRPDSS